MPPTRKVQLDKAAWAWAETVDPDRLHPENVRTAYRLTLPKCKVGICRRNCRGNPYCLSGLGEARWLGGSQEESDDEDQELELREINSFVGLKNLGATCYVNSLLQLWFHNLAFRRAIFKWNPLEDPVECMDVQSDENTVNPPRTIVGHLQLLFALMQFGKRKSVDPSEFIKALDLEPSTQQDAQEFSKLFISLLEDSLSQQSDLSVRNLINDNFRGEYSYITRCSKCQKESVSPSMFYELELNVKGNKTLHESITEFLKEEKLEGADMYSCGICQEKQEAARFIRLRSLPPVLNLQLMRFIYDRQKGHKKKLNSSIQFPDSLDMSSYISGREGQSKPLIYNLTAVLIHKGPSAYSGHYVAHICDQTTGTWYKFNDECVEKMEGKKLKLGCEEDTEDGTKKVKQPRLARGLLASSNAYMLVYTAFNVEEGKQPITEAILSPHLFKQVHHCNEAFDVIVESAKEERKNKKVNGKAHREEMASLLQTLPVGETNNLKWEAISTKWLSYWLTNTKLSTEPVNNTKLLCIHKKLDPNFLTEAKFINMNAAETIYSKYGGGPRLLLEESMCKECVFTKCREIRTRTKISEDAKEISNLLKQKDNLDAPGFWVGKGSLKSWRRKALASFIEKEEEDIYSARAREAREGPFGPKEEAPEPNNMTPSNDTWHQMETVSSETALPSTSVKSEDSLPPVSSVVDDSYPRSPVRKKCKLSRVSIMTLIDVTSDVVDNMKSKWSPFFKLYDNVDSIPFEAIKDIRILHCQVNNLSLKLKDFCDSYERIELSNNSSAESLAESAKSNDKLPNQSDGLEERIMNGMENVSKKRKKPRLEGYDEDKDMESGDESKTNGASNSRSDDDYENEEEFNEDIVCTHGNMVHEDQSRRLVSEHVWNIFKGYFPEAKEFPKETEPCHQCQSLASEGQVAKDMYRQQAQSQKELLQGLLQGRNRPKPQLGTHHIVSVTEFLDPWRKFVREAGRREPLYSLRNSSLICVHGLLLYNPDLEEDSSRIAVVTDQEWGILSGIYVVDQEITVSWGPNGELVSSPNVCEECVLTRLENEQKALLQYSKAKLYIRKVASSKSEEVIEVSPSSPPQAEGNSGVKRSRSETEAVRRSTRHRRTRGEKEVLMSSNQTLKDLKLQILYSCGIPPYDQHLMTEEGRELTDNEASLSSLNIYPNSVILVKVDEPPEDSGTPVEDFIRTSEPEAGFKGTGLMKRL